MHEAPIPFVQLKREGTHNPWGLWPVPIASSSSQRSIRKRCAFARGWFFWTSTNMSSKKETWNHEFSVIIAADWWKINTGSPLNDSKSKAHQCRWVLRKVTVSLWVSFFLQKSSLDPWSLPPLACRQCERCCLKGLRILQQYDLWWGIRRQWNTGCVIEVHFSFQKNSLETLFKDLFLFWGHGSLILSHSLDPVWNLDRWTLRHLYPPPPRKNV